MINAIRSNTISLAVLFLALVAQIPHAQTVFYDAGHSHDDTGWWLSLVFAIALESAVLMFVIHGWHTFSYAFAASSILVNAAYYDMLPGVFVKILVSVILPVAIACYSHLVAGDKDMSTHVSIDWRSRLSRVKNRLSIYMSKRVKSRGTDTLTEEVDNDSDNDSDNNSDNDSDNNSDNDSDNNSDKDSLSPDQRRSQLSKIVIDKNSVTTDDIDDWSNLYGVSQRTIRRDIDSIFGANGYH